MPPNLTEGLVVILKNYAHIIRETIKIVRYPNNIYCEERYRLIGVSLFSFKLSF